MIGAARRLPLTLLSPPGPRGRLSVLLYHRVLPEPDPLAPGHPDAETFRWQMQLLRRDFTPLHLDEAVRRLRRGSLPARAVAVTFDDGYADNATVALPILREAGVPATFFIATGYLDGGRMFNDTVIETVRRLPAGRRLDLTGAGLGVRELSGEATRRGLIEDLLRATKYRVPSERTRVVEDFAAREGVALPDDLMMTSAQVRTLHNAGMDVGGHTVNHPILSSVSARAAEAEIGGCREALEALTAAPVRTFAYPNGRPTKDYGAEHVAIVRRCGYTAAVSTAWGAANRRGDPFQLPRFTPWDRTPLRFTARLAANLRRGSGSLAG